MNDKLRLLFLYEGDNLEVEVDRGLLQRIFDFSRENYFNETKNIKEAAKLYVEYRDSVKLLRGDHDYAMEGIVNFMDGIFHMPADRAGYAVGVLRDYEFLGYICRREEVGLYAYPTEEEYEAVAAPCLAPVGGRA